MDTSRLKGIMSVALISATILTVMPCPINAGEVVKLRDGLSSIDATAQFESVAYISIEHEQFQIPKMDQAFWNRHSIVQDMSISVHGAPGEIVSVSCAILNEQEKSSFNNSCNGKSNIAPQEILSGDTFKDEVSLTKDMISKNGKPQKTISMRVSYI